MNQNRELRQKHFDSLRTLEPAVQVARLEELFDIRDPLFPLCEFLYNKCRDLCNELPPRKNGHHSFLHPINVVLTLKRCGVQDTTTLLCGLLHDYIEEHVDLHKNDKGIGNTESEKYALDEYEVRFVSKFEKELFDFCSAQKVNSAAVGHIIETLKLLTRLKRHYYYKSISYIFTCPDPELRERAIQVKLADRVHNILSVECFDEKGRLYQCFKNLFIINSTKHFLLEKYGSKVFTKKYNERIVPTERLFTRCSKATHGAFEVLCKLTTDKGIFTIKGMLQLAFKKYKLEYAGIWAITDLEEETHPMRLYQGIIRKWDSRLHHEWEEFERRCSDEIQYCNDFFYEFNFTEEQIQAIIDYKDSYCLKEVMCHLLYEFEYVINSFLPRQLDKGGRLKVAVATNTK